MKFILTSLVALSALWTSYAAAFFPTPSTASCQGPQIRWLSRPININKSSKKKFDFKFHVNRDEIDPEAPTVVFFPGGPGQTAMDKALSYPLEYQIIRIDPLGLGCNQNSSLRFVSSRDHALDAVAIIEHLDLKNYFLHGISYGTMTAVQAAYALEQKNASHLPKAVILEGILGRAFRENEYAEEYIKRWDVIFARLSSETRALLSSETLPLGLNGKQWAAFIAVHLLMGDNEDGQSPLEELLSLLHQKQEDQSWLKGYVLNFSKLNPPQQRKQHQEITCREIAPDMRDQQFDFTLTSGRLVLIPEKTYCAGIENLRPYDSHRFPLRSPLLLFHGEYDAATPQFQTNYFLQGQRSNFIYSITVPRGGHAALTASLAPCLESFWKSLLTSPSTESLNLSLHECLMK